MNTTAEIEGLSVALAEAESLLDTNWRIDERPGHFIGYGGKEKVVPVAVWFMYRAMLIGIGDKVQRDLRINA